MSQQQRGNNNNNNNNGNNTKVYQFKLVLLGESAVGKSSLVARFVKGHFHEYQESTIGAAFLTQTVCLDDTTVKFEIWDTAGQERYVNIFAFRFCIHAFTDVICSLIFFNIVNVETFFWI